MKFDVTYFLESFPQLFKYVYITLGITVVSMIISFEYFDSFECFECFFDLENEKIQMKDLIDQEKH